jgi:hypothetical protein
MTGIWLFNPSGSSRYFCFFVFGNGMKEKRGGEVMMELEMTPSVEKR